MIQARTVAAFLVSCSAFSFLAIGCDSNKTAVSNRPRAELVDSGQIAYEPPLGSKAVFYAFKPPASKIAFTGAKITNKHEGAFRSFEGTIGLVANDPVMSAVQVDIDVASLTTDSEKLASHLKSADFFDVAKFPKATFRSTTVRPGSAPATFNVTGKLELHGVTKPLTFPATLRVTPGAVDAEAEFKINRKDYGIVYPGMPDDLISDDVTIKLNIHAEPRTEDAGSAEPPADARKTD
jgi:polyisoprenoid-binding protein YceI